MAREFYIENIRLWPPPWSIDSPLRKALSYLWFLVLLPLMVITTVIGILMSVVSGLTGRNTCVQRSRAEVVEIIDDLLNESGQFDFGFFLHVRIEDTELESIRLRCLQLPKEYPPEEEGYWCSPAGIDELRRIADELRRHDC